MIFDNCNKTISGKEFEMYTFFYVNILINLVATD